MARSPGLFSLSLAVSHDDIASMDLLLFRYSSCSNSFDTYVYDGCYIVHKGKGAALYTCVGDDFDALLHKRLSVGEVHQLSSQLISSNVNQC